jgi:hypothetical protein
MMKEITLGWLEKNDACEESVKWFKAYDGPKEIEHLAEEMIRAGHADWVNWGIVRIMTKDQAVEYAVFAAEQVLSVYEAAYPDDDRPRKAISAATAYLSAVGRKEGAARAAEAAEAARAAAGAAGAAGAAWAAWAAAGAARAAGAAWAAEAAGAAWAAEAAGDAAYNDMLIKIVRHGLEIIGQTKEPLP